MIDEACDIMQSGLFFKREDINKYIKFISHFGPALVMGMAFWNNNKRMTNLLVSY
jgi:hypothetical protein